MKVIQVERREVVKHQFSDSVPALLQRIYAGRGITTDEELDLGLSQLLPYTSLLNINMAVDRCIEALHKQQRVLVVGDYDADGATSSALAIRLFRKMGLQQVNYIVPNRFQYGYGLSSAIVDVAISYQPDLIMTVDNGIASIEGVAKARQQGIDVLITDHHLPGNQLPVADVILNPNQHGDEFPSKMLAGVGVVFYLFMALRSALRERGWFAEQGIEEPNLADYLDIVALGTMADVVPLDRNNRILVKQGLLRMRAGRAHAGILALIETARKTPMYLCATDLGFSLAPQLNAAGRLGDMSLGVECLLTDDNSRARQLAAKLNAMNHERRQFSKLMEDEALLMLKKIDIGKKNQSAYCLYQESWHEGIIGILAGRLKDKVYRPVIVFAQGEGDELKGSGRSIPGFHMRDALDAVALRYPHLLQKFGGHAMAAGLSLKKVHLQHFSEAFQCYADKVLDQDITQQKLLTEGTLQSVELTVENASLIENSGPWGQCFPEPKFDGVFSVLNRRRIGSDNMHLKLVLDYQGISIDAVAFFMSDNDWPEEQERVNLVYKLNVNRFHGVENIQLIIQHVSW